MILSSFLAERGMIRVKQSATDWKDAVRIGVGCLVSAGKADWSYYSAIIHSVVKNGPYFLLMPGVALPHARPDDKVVSTGFSLVTLDRPVSFGSDKKEDQINILLSFCSPQLDDQLEAIIGEAVSLFENQDYVDKLTKAHTIGEVEKVLRNVGKKVARQSTAGRVKRLLKFFSGKE